MLSGGGGGHGGHHGGGGHGGGGGGHHGGGHHGGHHGGGWGYPNYWYGGYPYYRGYWPEVVVDPIYVLSDTPNDCGGWSCAMHKNMCPCTCPFRQLNVTPTPSSLTGLGAVISNTGTLLLAAAIAVGGLYLASRL